uniref:Uncharacterized protein n=1 Tax=Ixodes ricinus TaxID=34613 RepID=A0A6B0USK9_IXORI
MQRISSWIELLATQLMSNLSLITLPSLASATARLSCASLATTFLSTFLSVLLILPSMADVAAARAWVMSSNFSKCFSLTTRDALSGVSKSLNRLSVCWSFFSSRTLKMAYPAGDSNRTSILWHNVARKGASRSPII